MEELRGKDIWEKSLEILRTTVGEKEFHMWFNPVKFVSYQNNSLTLEVPNRFIADWLKKNYLDKVKKSLSQIIQKEPEIIFTSRSNHRRKRKPASLPTFLQGELEFEFNLNPDFTFEEFVVGPGNRFAHAASLAVAESPGKSYNPLFIYGGVGLGKTHLIQAIGHYMLNSKKRIRVHYTSSERFTNQLITAIQNKNTESFRKRYRNVDALLIDDIHFIAGKESTEEEFFHTFNELYNSGRQIVITGDRPPSEIPTVEKRLVSRFHWGLVVEIQPPDFETRVAILRRKAAYRGFTVSDDVLYYIAEGITSNIRVLEGALIKVIAYSSLNKVPVDKKVAQEVLKDIIKTRKENVVTVDRIKNAVIDFFHLKSSDLISKKRSRSVALPRQIAMYLTRELTELSLPEIGLNFGGRDHTTVLHACEKVRELMEKDEKFKEILDNIKERIFYPNVDN